ncbi:hypothetical protein AQJ30_15755 [Streptomyces longwoodensis]|uniref:Uncharacterized protein n=1 Tax=Streptomyces longwoodensis TaxID=68231 RepID=A0A124HR83_9ACTN|nr:hypothetical protein [Streptomyces longwoodensis]KUN37737.1 hypothetical protein AQJ30_15755 [Streptomyces longwoodensis]
MTTYPCPNPACDGRRRTGQYLCWDCWDALPAPARTQLSRRDPAARARLQLLYRQLQAGVPPQRIQIEPIGA